jgi:hypothetical protein
MSLAMNNLKSVITLFTFVFVMLKNDKREKPAILSFLLMSLGEEKEGGHGLTVRHRLAIFLLLHHLPECWAYRHMAPCLALINSILILL